MENAKLFKIIKKKNKKRIKKWIKIDKEKKFKNK